MNIIDLSKYLPKDPSQDATPAVARALADASGMERPTLVFPKGVWHFWPDRAFEKHYYISNNTVSSKRILFPLMSAEGYTIDGGGSEFLMHGRLLPFVLDNCKDITLRNFTIDSPKPLYSQGMITDCGPDFVEFTMDSSKFNGFVEGNRLVAYTDEFEYWAEAGLFMLEWDPVKKEPAFDQYAAYARQSKHAHAFFSKETGVITASQTGDRLRLMGQLGHEFHVGNELHINWEARHAPTIFATQSTNLLLEDITIYHSLSMGLIAQVCADITVRRMRVEVRPGSGRTVSANADATHFVGCWGHILMEDCVFDSMMDDATNIHSMYTKITAQPAPNQIEVRLGHHEQEGTPLYAAGDRIALVRQADFAYLDEAVVTQVQVLNSQYFLLTLDRPLDNTTGNVIDLPDKMPTATLRRIRTGKNRSRGFLISTNKEVLIEDCEFHNSCSAIMCTGDTDSWCESGPVQNMTIRNCLFNDVGYEKHHPAIDLAPSIQAAEAPPYHRNIVIENNRFILNSNTVFKAKFADNVTMRNNTYSRTEQYPFMDTNLPLVVLDRCTNMHCEDPIEE